MSRKMHNNGGQEIHLKQQKKMRKKNIKTTMLQILCRIAKKTPLKKP